MRRSTLFLLGTILFLSAICTMYWACGDPTGKENKLDDYSQALNDTGAQSEPDPQQVLAAKSRNVRSSELVESLRPFMTDSNVDDITIKWNYSDNIKLFWGDGLAIDLSRVGCGLEDNPSSIICFLDKYSNDFGVDATLGDLRLVRERPLGSGHVVYRFKQYIGLYPVWGSVVAVTLNPQGHLTRIYSHYVKGLEVRQNGYSSLEDLYAAADNEFLVGKIRERLSNTDFNFHSKDSIIFVDRKDQSTVGIPSFFLTVEDSNGELVDAIVDAETGEIYHSKNRKVEYNAKQINKTRVAYPEFTTTNCLSGACLGPPGHPYTCSYDMLPDGTGKCVDKCGDNDECDGEYSDWKCWTSGSFTGYCYMDGAGTEETIHDTNGWVQTAYSYHKRYKDLKDKMNEVMAFHYDDLYRYSWNGSHGHYNTYLMSHCCSPGQGCSFSQDCPFGGSTGSIVVYYSWNQLAQSDTRSRNDAYNTLSHEWGHCIVYDEAGGWNTVEPCFDENLAYMFGSLLAVDKVGGSSVRWDYDCDDSESNHRSPWDDEPDGLSGGCMWIPYCQRSRFDWFDCSGQTWGIVCTEDDHCPPYEICETYSGSVKKCSNDPNVHRNGYVWARFIRVLAEGPDTFDNDGNNEDVGVSFTAVGWPTTARIIHDAIAGNIDTTTTLEELVDLIISAGSTHGKVWEVRKALGIVGFQSYTGNPTSGESTSGYYKYYFSAWNKSSNKYFYVWRDSTSPNIKVHYHNGTSWTTDTISANSNAGPTVVEYNSRLYIFWRNQSTQAIQFKYYRYDGYKWGPYDLYNKYIWSYGSFDAAVFNNYLYLVYSYGGTVYLSKCTSTICSTSGWHYFTSGYKKSLGYSAYPGMGVDVASALNGTGSVTRMYIASADYSYPYYRIRVDQVNTSDNKTHTSYMPTNYPSYRTYPYKEIGLKAVSSAFPSATTYLYLIWKDYSSSKIYTSVVQKYDDDDDSDTWFTRSVDTFLDSYTGVRFMKGDGAAVDLVQIAHTDTGYDIHYSYLYGRY